MKTCGAFSEVVPVHELSMNTLRGKAWGLIPFKGESLGPAFSGGQYSVECLVSVLEILDGVKQLEKSDEQPKAECLEDKLDPINFVPVKSVLKIACCGVDRPADTDYHESADDESEGDLLYETLDRMESDEWKFESHNESDNGGCIGKKDRCDVYDSRKCSVAVGNGVLHLFLVFTLWLGGGVQKNP